MCGFTGFCVRKVNVKNLELSFHVLETLKSVTIVHWVQCRRDKMKVLTTVKEKNR